MHILTINLSEKFAAQLTSLIKSRITHSKTMTDACLLIKKNEFSLIVKKTDAKNPENQFVITLLGLTPISTKILLIGKTVNKTNLFAWQALGIDFLLDPSANEIAQKIQTNKP